MGGFLVSLWSLEIVDEVVLRGNLDRHGIVPRSLDGLDGILWAPLLHGNFAHLLANSVPLLILGWLILARGGKDFAGVTAIAWLLGGLGTWMFGHSGVHIGASGVVFGYLGYLMALGYYERKFTTVLLSLGVGYFFGSCLFGILPGQHGISWEGHLFGLLGGILAARLLARKS